MSRFGIRTRSGLIFNIIQTQSATSIDADAQAFFDRVTAAGGTLTATEKDAVNTLTVSLKSNGTWNLMKAIYPMVGASASACAQNLKSSSYTGTFSSGWTFSSNGVTPDAASAFMNTALNPFGILDYNSFHISYYSRTQNTTFNGGAIGQGDGGAGNTYLAPYYAGTASKFFLNGYFPTNAVQINNTTTTGLNIGNKQSSTSRKLYNNGTLLATNTGANIGSAFPGYAFYLGANNNNGIAQFFTGFQCAFSSIGDGLSDTNASDFNTAVQTFQTSLSRQV